MFTPTANAAMCRVREAWTESNRFEQQVCILKLKRSAKNYWEYRAKVSIDGEKQRDDDLKRVKDFLQDTSGVDISTDKKIDKVIDAMKNHGIVVNTTEMDVS